jgi:hypothetical protein
VPHASGSELTNDEEEATIADGFVTINGNGVMVLPYLTAMCCPITFSNALYNKSP